MRLRLPDEARQFYAAKRSLACNGRVFDLPTYAEGTARLWFNRAADGELEIAGLMTETEVSLEERKRMLAIASISGGDHRESQFLAVDVTAGPLASVSFCEHEKGEFESLADSLAELVGRMREWLRRFSFAVCLV